MYWNLFPEWFWLNILLPKESAIWRPCWGSHKFTPVVCLLSCNSERNGRVRSCFVKSHVARKGVYLVEGYYEWGFPSQIRIRRNLKGNFFHTNHYEEKLGRKLILFLFKHVWLASSVKISIINKSPPSQIKNKPKCLVVKALL